MTRNFEHMAPWKSIYEDFELAESNALKGRRAEQLLAMKCMGSAFEKMVSLLVQKAGYRDSDVEQYKSNNGLEGRADLYGRILLAGAYELIPAESFNNYNELRSMRNQSVHDGYATATDAQVKEAFDKMYAMIYRESWLWANQYMKRVGVMPKPVTVFTEKVGSRNDYVQPQRTSYGLSTAGEFGTRKQTAAVSRPVQGDNSIYLPFEYTDGPTITNKVVGKPNPNAYAIVLILWILAIGAIALLMIYSMI